jgi:hypothetical protein
MISGTGICQGRRNVLRENSVIRWGVYGKKENDENIPGLVSDNLIQGDCLIKATIIN